MNRAQIYYYFCTLFGSVVYKKNYQMLGNVSLILLQNTVAYKCFKNFIKFYQFVDIFYITPYDQGRQQKNFQGGRQRKKKIEK